MKNYNGGIIMDNKIYSITRECELAGDQFTTFEIKDGNTTLIQDSFDGIGFSEAKSKQCIEDLLEKVNIYSLERLKRISLENDLKISITDNNNLITFGDPDFSNCIFKKYDNFFYKQEVAAC